MKTLYKHKSYTNTYIELVISKPTTTTSSMSMKEIDKENAT